MLQVTGLDAVTGSFLLSGATVMTQAAGVTDAHAERMASAQRAEIPVYEGETRDSVRNTRVDVEGGYGRSVGPTHFVARFLQNGTVNMSQKMDLFAASQPAVDSWLDALGEIAEVR